MYTTCSRTARVQWVLLMKNYVFHACLPDSCAFIVWFFVWEIYSFTDGDVSCHTSYIRSAFPSVRVSRPCVVSLMIFISHPRLNLRMPEQCKYISISDCSENVFCGLRCVRSNNILLLLSAQCSFDTYKLHVNSGHVSHVLLYWKCLVRFFTKPGTFIFKETGTPLTHESACRKSERAHVR